MVYLIIISAIIIRFVIHFTAIDMANIAPITALAIFGAAYLPKKQAIAIPFLARFISDLFIGFFQWPLMVAVYASHMVGILFGLWIKKESKYRWLKIAGSALGAAIIFYTVTNFAFLYPYYPHNLSGILQSYVNGLPFLRNTIIGDMGYTLALFGVYELACAYFRSRQKSKILDPKSGI